MSNIIDLKPAIHKAIDFGCEQLESIALSYKAYYTALIVQSMLAQRMNVANGKENNITWLQPIVANYFSWNILRTLSGATLTMSIDYNEVDKLPEDQRVLFFSLILNAKKRTITYSKAA